MERNIYFLKDGEINDWLIQGFSERHFPIIFMGIKNSSQFLQKSRIRRILVLHFGYLKLACKSIFQSKSDDIMLCLLDVLGLYLFVVSKILFCRRKIVLINLMLNDQDDLITSIKHVLFKWMLKSKNVYPTVTSSYLSEFYRRKFHLQEKDFYLLHDCYGKLGNYKRLFKEGGGYIFCGGTNGRDWDVLLKVAKLLPNIKFVIVGPKCDTLGNNYPQNIDYYYDIPFEKFQKLIENCSIVALPIKTQAPAGLIVLYTAGLMSKPVITTNNVTIIEYLTAEENGILVKKGDYEDFAYQSERLFRDQTKQRLLGERLFERVEAVGSPQVFIGELILIIKNIQQR